MKVKISKQIIESINALIDYNWADEKKHYESDYDCEVPEEITTEWVETMDQDHIFYDLCVVHLFLNQ